MPDIDLEPRAHSHLYEIKPMSRWWLVPSVGLLLLGLFINGITAPTTWALALFSMFFGWALFLIFPRKWLSKID